MNIASILKAEIARVARKEIKGTTQFLKKSSSQYRADIAALKRRVAGLEKIIGQLSKKNGASKSSKLGEDSPTLRFRSSGFASLRKKLGLTATEMGRLLCVSDQSVYKWEQGKAQPRASQLSGIAAVRKMGKKAVSALLSERAT